VSRDGLAHALTTRTRQTPEGPIISPLNVRAATENRDSLAKVRLFVGVWGCVWVCVCVGGCEWVGLCVGGGLGMACRQWCGGWGSEEAAAVQHTARQPTPSLHTQPRPFKNPTQPSKGDLLQNV